MNAKLESYAVDVRFPNVSGAEHFQMLQTRDETAEKVLFLSPEEQRLLDESDLRFQEHVEEVYAELSRFVDLESYRVERGIAFTRRWWYVDAARYYRIPDYEGGFIVLEWGTTITWFFELNAWGDAQRQMCIYPNGKVTSYDRTHKNDEFGALMVMVTQTGEEWQLPFEISREEFEREWSDHTPDNRTL